jgi:hypothetical protein
MSISKIHNKGLKERSGRDRVEYAVKEVTIYKGRDTVEVTFDGTILVEGSSRYCHMTSSDTAFFGYYRCIKCPGGQQCRAAILISNDVTSGSTLAIINSIEHQHQRVSIFKHSIV